jgi:hypothetical protein
MGIFSKKLVNLEAGFGKALEEEILANIQIRELQILIFCEWNLNLLSPYEISLMILKASGAKDIIITQHKVSAYI